MKKYILLLILALFLVSGCSHSNGIVEPGINLVIADYSQPASHLNWGIWDLSISADHRQVDVVPKRDAKYHYCVTRFMEKGPCMSCLTIAPPEIQPDNTVKLNVTLRHPFPGTPRYTGFDVRGIVYFPPTETHAVTGLTYRCRIYDNFGGANSVFPLPYGSNMPIIFSRAEQDGGELLNADGYSCYLIPGLTYSEDWPIFSYSEPKNNIKPTPELTTINPYKLFCSDSERRMFLVTDEITREYHIALPQGPFTFGYAVDASWWPPDNKPVTDPATDFPPEANAEDPWLIEYEQLLPICEENVEKNVFKITIHHRKIDNDWWLGIWSWGLTTGPYNLADPLLYANDLVVVDDYTIIGYGKVSSAWWYLYGKDGLATPGNHLGVLVVQSSEDDPPYTTELEHVYGVRFIDIYVEE